MPADPNRVQAIFLGAIEEPSDARTAYLERECGEDAALRARVEALLAAHDEPGSFVSEAEASPGTIDRPDSIPGVQGTVDLPTDRASTGTFDPDGATGTFGGSHSSRDGSPAMTLGTVIAGRYTLAEVIGEGGMGSVYLAEQSEPVKRRVALKLIKTGMDSKGVLARFDAERQALALMDHPNIARIYDGGVTPAGQPFFVMELVQGVPLTEYCDAKRLTVDARLQLFVAVCQAVQHAHQKGIIHRDLKPGNVLVTEVDGRPTPKVIDFGVAKATEVKLTEMSFSDVGAVVGTPTYMSPEQADPSSMDIDTRTDVYALGVMLYELLTGSPPIDARQFKRGAILEMLRMVREVEPPRPSTRLSEANARPNVAANRNIDPAKLAKLLQGELDWVVMKALEKDRTRRYETANAFARDLQRYLADEVVEARPPSRGYRMKKFVKRNPLQLTLAGLVAVILLGGVSVVLWQLDQAGARREADLRQQLVDEQRASADTARLARNQEAVAALLGQAEQALQAGDTAKSEVVLEAAKKRSAEGVSEEQQRVLNLLTSDLGLLQDLEAIDRYRWTPVENQLPDPAKVVARTREALRRFGADPDAVSVDEAVTRVSASVVRERIVLALDRLLSIAKPAEVRAVLRRVDADPYRDAVRDAVLANDRAKLQKLLGENDALKQPPGFAAFLGESDEIAEERRRQVLQAAVSQRPDDLSLLMTLGETYVYNQKEGAKERLRWFQAAVAVAPKNVAAHTSLGIALQDIGDVDGALASTRTILELDPNLVFSHLNLGVALLQKGELDEAIVSLRKAIELGPNAAGHMNLASALLQKGDVDGAIANYHKALEFYPKFMQAHFNLGLALFQKGDVDGAIASYRKAHELNPKDTDTRTALGAALLQRGDVGKGDVDEAIAIFRKALELNPKDTDAQTILSEALLAGGEAYAEQGVTLLNTGDVDGAIARFKKAIELDPKNTAAHVNLGIALQAKGQVDAAIASYRKAIELDPKFSMAHHGLGFALDAAGKQLEAIAAWRRSVALQPAQPNVWYWIAKAEANQGRINEADEAFRKVAELYPADSPRGREARQFRSFSAVLRGEGKPTDPAERLEFARLAHQQKRYAFAARQSAEAFAAEPKLADDLKTAHRYNAARSAALAAVGQGKEEAPLDDAAKAKLRGQALEWLMAELSAWGKHPSQRAIMRTVNQWQQDIDLVAIRDKEALAKLPAEERQAFTKLWADVAELRKKAESGFRALPVAAQVEEIRKELQERNPGYDGNITPTIEKDTLTGLNLDNNPKVVDLTPLKGMHFKSLGIMHTGVTDLTPLNGMPLEMLKAWGWRGSDLTPLKGMPLKWLNCGGGGGKLDLTPLAGLPLDYLCINHTQVSDLGPLKDLPLTRLLCSNTQVTDLTPLRKMRLRELTLVNGKVSDLSPLQGMPLERLEMKGAWVTDLTSLKGMPLKYLTLTPANILRGMESLRGVKSLETIGIDDKQVWPAAEFWTRYDKGEFEPKDWSAFHAQSLLGGSLLGQKKYADAEQMLVKGYEGMKAREKDIPPEAATRIPEALDRLIELYTATNKPDEAKKYRELRAKYPKEQAPKPREKVNK